VKRVVVKFQYESLCPWCRTLEHTLINWLRFGIPNERVLVCEKEESGGETRCEFINLRSVVVDEAKRMGLSEEWINELFSRKPIVVIEEMVDVFEGKPSDSLEPIRRLGIDVKFEVPSITIEFYKDGKLVNRVVYSAPISERIENYVADPGKVKIEIARAYARIKHIIDLFYKS